VPPELSSDKQAVGPSAHDPNVLALPAAFNHASVTRRPSPQPL
jgi:hypothetical protein